MYCDKIHQVLAPGTMFPNRKRILTILNQQLYSYISGYSMHTQ